MANEHGTCDDLLEQARHLANRDRTRPRQVNLRRAISNPYYSLFHLLSNSVASNWKHRGHRHDFARLLQHGPMRQVCDATCKKAGSNKATHAPLSKICSAFVELQQLRYAADYDCSRTWSKAEAEKAIDLAGEAQALWAAIADEPTSHDFLFFLLARDRR